jgi:hypothetical protein
VEKGLEKSTSNDGRIIYGETRKTGGRCIFVVVRKTTCRSDFIFLFFQAFKQSEKVFKSWKTQMKQKKGMFFNLKKYCGIHEGPDLSVALVCIYSAIYMHLFQP